MGVTAVGTDALRKVSDPEVQRFLREKWALIEERFAPVHFVLFGSRVNGTPYEWSDIDFIVVSQCFSDIRFVKRSYYFQTIVCPHIPVTALCYTPKEFINLRSGIGVVADACREGIWLK